MFLSFHKYFTKARLIGITLIMIGCLSFIDSVIFSPKKEAREVLVLAEFFEDSFTSVMGVIYVLYYLNVRGLVLVLLLNSSS